MNFSKWQSCIKSLDARRQIALPGDESQTLEFCADYFLERTQKAILEKGFFTVALSGGSTPIKIFELLSQKPYRSQIEWEKILFFFGDERSVPPTDDQSNYKMAMDSFLKDLNIPFENIFRMVAEQNGAENAEAYEKLIHEKVPEARFDLITLGMGDDGHTASLFPDTKALKVQGSLVCMNEVPQKKTHRMTLTYECINQAHHICFFVLGSNKATILPKVLQGAYTPVLYPSQKIGTEVTPALWIVDQEAQKGLKL